jgi:protoheme IX farnesyltransferase
MLTKSSASSLWKDEAAPQPWTAGAAVPVASLTPGAVQWLCDVVELTKPRITLMVLVTVAISGYVAAWGRPDWGRLWHAVVGTALVAAGSGVMNQWLERQGDRRMHRTCQRPLAARRVGVGTAWGLILSTTVIGLVYLYWFAGAETATWAFATWFGYVALYTPLKRITPLNTAVGAIFGAMPIFIGWSAAGAPYTHRCALLFLLLVVWQFPHFMAIAWLYRDDYRRAGLQMITVVDPSGRAAGQQAILGCLALLPISFLLVFGVPHMATVAYLFASVIFGTIFLAAAVAFRISPSVYSARWLLRASLIYLPAVLLLLAGWTAWVAGKS